jgi:hypothetical protein
MPIFIKRSFFVDYPLSGAIDICILLSLHNQAPKKMVFYENQHISQDLLESLN